MFKCADTLVFWLWQDADSLLFLWCHSHRFLPGLSCLEMELGYIFWYGLVLSTFLTLLTHSFDVIIVPWPIYKGLCKHLGFWQSLNVVHGSSQGSHISSCLEPQFYHLLRLYHPQCLECTYMESRVLMSWDNFSLALNPAFLDHLNKF